MWTNLLNVKQILAEGLLQFRVPEFIQGFYGELKKAKIMTIAYVLIER